MGHYDEQREAHNESTREYPNYYSYSHGKSSDKAWIMSRLDYIPAAHHFKVCREYEKLVCTSSKDPFIVKQHRDAANTYLLAESKKHGAKV